MKRAYNEVSKKQQIFECQVGIPALTLEVNIVGISDFIEVDQKVAWAKTETNNSLNLSRKYSEFLRIKNNLNTTLVAQNRLIHVPSVPQNEVVRLLAATQNQWSGIRGY